MVQIQRNEIVGQDNQKLTITLISGGSPVIPSELHFAIFEINSTEKVLEPVKVFPETTAMEPVDIFNTVENGGGKVSDGRYIARFQMDPQASLGRSKIVWYYKTNSSQPSYTEFEEEFETIDYVEVYGSGGRPILSYNEIRTFLRDLPEHHVLVDGMLFSDSEIAVAMGQVVDHFNRINPPLGFVDLANFPDKYLLTMGTAAWLLDSEANRQLMEQLTYQDGNIHHGLTDKTQLYRQAAATLKQDYMQTAREIKMAININGIYNGQGLGVRFASRRLV